MAALFYVLAVVALAVAFFSSHGLGAIILFWCMFFTGNHFLKKKLEPFEKAQLKGGYTVDARTTLHLLKDEIDRLKKELASEKHASDRHLTAYNELHKIFETEKKSAADSFNDLYEVNKSLCEQLSEAQAELSEYRSSNVYMALKAEKGISAKREEEINMLHENLKRSEKELAETVLKCNAEIERLKGRYRTIPCLDCGRNLWVSLNSDGEEHSRWCNYCHPIIGRLSKPEEPKPRMVTKEAGGELRCMTTRFSCGGRRKILQQIVPNSFIDLDAKNIRILYEVPE